MGIKKFTLSAFLRLALTVGDEQSRALSLSCLSSSFLLSFSPTPCASLPASLSLRLAFEPCFD